MWNSNRLPSKISFCCIMEIHVVVSARFSDSMCLFSLYYMQYTHADEMIWRRLSRVSIVTLYFICSLIC